MLMATASAGPTPDQLADFVLSDVLGEQNTIENPDDPHAVLKRVDYARHAGSY